MVAWDKKARAVVPCSFMEEATDPLLGTFKNSEISPLPYGVGVYIVDPKDGLERALPLYWVSPKAAHARGVKSAWYVPADPNNTFKLKVSNVQTVNGNDKTHIRKVPVEPGKKCGVEIFVDGMNVGGDRKYKMADPGKEREIRGFTVARNYDAGDYIGKKAVRAFRFLKAETVEQSIDNENDSTGKIELRQFCGLLRSSPLIAATESRADDLKESKPIDEKKAIKDGCSITVDRSGALIEEPSSRDTQYIQRSRSGGEEIGCVTLFVREKRWLETHRIIDCDGNPYRKPVAVGGEETTAPLSGRRKRKRVSNSTRPRKTIRETIVIDD